MRFFNNYLRYFVLSLFFTFLRNNRLHFLRLRFFQIFIHLFFSLFSFFCFNQHHRNRKVHNPRHPQHQILTKLQIIIHIDSSLYNFPWHYPIISSQLHLNWSQTERSCLQFEDFCSASEKSNLMILRRSCQAQSTFFFSQLYTVLW